MMLNPRLVKNERLNYSVVRRAMVTLSCSVLLGSAPVALANKPMAQNSAQPLAKTTAKYKIGGAYWCRRLPAFVSKLDLKQPVAIDTAQSRFPGVVVREVKAQQRLYRHPSWQMSGHTASTVMDSQGNIYVIPVPSVGLDTNPLAKRNTLYRIDAQTGVMSEFMALPLPEDDGKRNPFGTVGLAFDCDTNSLYVSSVAGSTPREQKGVIYQIDVQARTILSQYKATDAIGLAVFNFANEKRLYFGSARTASLASISLDAKGGFFGPAKFELSLLDIKNGRGFPARKIRFAQSRSGQYFMQVKDGKFDCRPNAETAQAHQGYHLKLDEGTQQWRHHQQ